jgi:hypothetical protein
MSGIVKALANKKAPHPSIKLGYRASRLIVSA